jgi:hypothetical protein
MFAVLQLQTSRQCIGCGTDCGMLSTSNGTFSDGSGAANYVAYSTCEWLIAPPGALEITLRFTEFSTQAANDVVRVYQCTDVYCTQQQQLAELSGTYSGIQTIKATTGFMSVVFTTDGSVNAAGFAANWSSVCMLLLFACPIDA